MYDQLLRAIELYFDEEKVLRRSARGVITLLRHRKTLVSGAELSTE